MTVGFANKVIIAGGGITGLAAAWIAARAGARVTLLEAGESFGGLMATFSAGPARLECFYHHIFTHDAEIQWLLRELNLADGLIFPKTTMGIFRHGKIWNFNGISDLFRFRPLGMPDKIRFAATAFHLARFKKWQACEEVSASHWLRRFAGKNAFETIWGPMLAIKFGPFAEKVPLSWMVGRLRQRISSRQGAGGERLGYLRGSLDLLLQALLSRLRQAGVDLVSGAPVLGMRVAGGKAMAVETPAGCFEGDSFLFTIPSPRLAKVVASADPGLARGLETLEYFGAVCVVLELDRSLSPVYWLNVADPGFPFGGIIEQTRLLPPEHYGNRHVVYLSRYFAAHETMAGMTENEIKDLMIPCLARIRPDVQEQWILRTHVFKTMTAAPVCDVGFSRKVRACRSSLPNLFYAGMPHVYPDERSVNNSIRVAAEACRAMGIESGFVPRGQSLAGQIGLAPEG